MQHSADLNVDLNMEDGDLFLVSEHLTKDRIRICSKFFGWTSPYNSHFVFELKTKIYVFEFTSRLFWHQLHTEKS